MLYDECCTARFIGLADRPALAPVAELVDALDSKSSAARLAGSIPAGGTKLKPAVICAQRKFTDSAQARPACGWHIQPTRPTTRLCRVLSFPFLPPTSGLGGYAAGRNVPRGTCCRAEITENDVPRGTSILVKKRLKNVPRGTFSNGFRSCVATAIFSPAPCPAGSGCRRPAAAAHPALLPQSARRPRASPAASPTGTARASVVRRLSAISACRGHRRGLA